MGPTLPRVFGWILLAFACHHADPPVAPGPPLPAEPDISVTTMDDECHGLIAALETYQKCPNADNDDRAWARAWIEAAKESIDAGDKAHADAEAQRTMAINCKRAATSVRFADVRCHAGPKPKPD